MTASPERCRPAGKSLSMVVWATGGSSWWPKNTQIWSLQRRSSICVSDPSGQKRAIKFLGNLVLFVLCVFMPNAKWERLEWWRYPSVLSQKVKRRARHWNTWRYVAAWKHSCPPRVTGPERLVCFLNHAHVIWSKCRRSERITYKTNLNQNSPWWCIKMIPTSLRLCWLRKASKTLCQYCWTHLSSRTKDLLLIHGLLWI